MGERRQLTILFADLVGSTALSARLDPEDLREVITAYHQTVTNLATRFGGFVARYMGDGVLVYFGYPQANEDDPEQAIRAGLTIVESVGHLSTIAGPRGTLSSRVGIATGVVVVGELIGSGASLESSVIGEVPNLASRLQTLAEPGTIVIADRTRRLTGGLFEYRDLGLSDQKGLGLVHAWEVLGESTIDSRYEALHPDRAPLVGREEDLELLVSHWKEAKSGEGRVVLLSGDPGIGKSRVVRALRDRLRADPHTSVNYFCSPHHQSSALYPHIIQLTRATGIDRDDGADVRLEKLQALLAQSSSNLEQDMPLFAALLSIPAGDRYPPPDTTPQRRKERMLAALLDQLKRLAARQPVLVTYEDLHWIDPTTLELLSLAIQQISNQRILLLATARPEFSPPWPGHRHVSTLSLNRFGRSECEALIGSITKGKFLPPQVVDQIVARTDGVPLFIEELTKTVLESGLLRETADHFELTGPLPPLAIPSTLHGSLLARLDRLASVKDVAQIGAVIGREFSHVLIAAVAALPEKDLNSALSQLVATELIYQRGVPPDATYIFKHALVQNASYASLVRARRQQLHGAIASALEERFADTVATEPETVAYHFTEAGLAERGALYWHRAGELSLRRSSVNEAVTHFTNGLRTLEAMADKTEADRRELDLRLSLGTALNIAHGSSYSVVGEEYDRALTLARQFGVNKQLFRALWGSWYSKATSGRSGQALVLANELVDVAEQLADQDLILEAHHARWASTHLSGLIHATLAEIERGIRLYREDRHRGHAYEYGGHDSGVCAYGHRAVTLWIAGFPEQAQQASAEALALGRRLLHPPSLMHAAWWAAILRACLESS